MTPKCVRMEAVMKKNMKKLICMMLTVVLVFSLAACGKSSVSGKVLNLYVWTEYVPDSVIAAFEKESGIKVNVSTYSSNEDMLAKVKSESEGAFDIVQPSDYMVKQLISQDMLQKLDQTKLTNMSNIGTQYLNPKYDPGNVYSVPYQGGVAAIAVNTAKIKDTITSYDDLFNPKYSNTLVVLDDYRAVIGMTARSMGLSMNETDSTTLGKIQTKLLTIKNNVKLYDSDSPKSALISGDCNLAFCWNAEIALAMEENPDIKIVFPKEGAYTFMDNWCVTKGAKNYDAAMEFINYMLTPDAAKLVMAEFPYLNPNTVAVSQMGADYSANPAKNVPAEVLNKGEYLDNLSTSVLEKYDQMWTELKK